METYERGTLTVGHGIMIKADSRFCAILTSNVQSKLTSLPYLSKTKLFL